MNGGPFAPLQAPRAPTHCVPVKGMTSKRLHVLHYVERESGATRLSPVALHGQSFAAARWLYEHGYLGMCGREFYPLKHRPSAHEDRYI